MTLEERIAKRIGDIPASGGGYIEVCQVTLRSKLSPSMLREIAHVAADEARKTETAGEGFAGLPPHLHPR